MNTAQRGGEVKDLKARSMDSTIRPGHAKRFSIWPARCRARRSSGASTRLRVICGDAALR